MTYQVPDYYTRRGGIGLTHLGQDQAPEPSRLPIWIQQPSPLTYVWSVAHFVSVPALAYHGYKRNNSVGWAVVWGLFGSMVWPITVPVALAQGYAKRKTNRNRRRRRTTRRRRRTSRRSR